MKKKSPYHYHDPSFLQRWYRFFRHPKNTLQWVEWWGWKAVLQTTWTGGLLPPPLKYWAVEKGWPRKHVTEATKVIQLDTLKRQIKGNLNQ
jgi:hypothetical protein